MNCLLLPNATLAPVSTAFGRLIKNFRSSTGDLWNFSASLNLGLLLLESSLPVNFCISWISSSVVPAGSSTVQSRKATVLTPGCTVFWLSKAEVELPVSGAGDGLVKSEPCDTGKWDIGSSPEAGGRSSVKNHNQTYSHHSIILATHMKQQVQEPREFVPLCSWLSLSHLFGLDCTPHMGSPQIQCLLNGLTMDCRCQLWRQSLMVDSPHM